MIEIAKIGLIEIGDESGSQIKVVDDSENTGGFFILTSKDLTDLSIEGFNTWVANKDELVGYFKESKWIIRWS